MSEVVNQSRRTGFSSSRSYSAAPFILYRAESFSSLRTRAIIHFRRARLRYLSHPAFSRCFLLFGKMVWRMMFYLIAVGSLPFLLVTFLVTQIGRRALKLLVKRRFPDVIFTNDSSPRPLNLLNPAKTATSSDLVSSLIWVKGRLDLNTIQSCLEARILSQDSSLFLLRKMLKRRYFLQVWEDSSTFSISKHVMLGPSNWRGKLMSDEPLRELSGYSVLQSFIGESISTPRDPELPPWEVTVIPLPYNRTLLLLRFHKLLLKDKAVVKMFLSSLGQNSVKEDGITLELDHISAKDHLPFGESDEVKSFPEESKLPWDKKGKEFLESLNQELKSFFSDLGSWMALRARQSECNSRLALIQSVILEASVKVLKPGPVLKKPFSCLLSFVGKMCQFFLAVLHTPKILLNDLVPCGRNPRKVGFFLREGGEKAVSWSKPVGSDFLHEVAEKGEVSEEAVILTGISMALNDYYRENGITNMKKVGAIISSNSELPKYLILNTGGVQDVPKQIVSLDHYLTSFPVWKQKSLSYLRNFSTQVLPAFLSFHLVQKRVNDQFPVQVNFIDTESSFPSFTFWGRNVEEFSFWKEPCTPCISITVIKYSGSFRVFVLSPFKSLDTFLSHRFPQYLNQTAEYLGLDRARIPYSRKSSPVTSNASSPTGMAVEPSPALLNRRIRSCHSLIC